MKDPVLLDSDVLIEVLRGRNQEVLDRWGELISSEAMLAYSPVTAAEIWHGAREPEREAASEMFSVLTCIPIGAEIGRRGGILARVTPLDSKSKALSNARRPVSLSPELICKTR